MRSTRTIRTVRSRGPTRDVFPDDGIGGSGGGGPLPPPLAITFYVTEGNTAFYVNEADSANYVTENSI